MMSFVAASSSTAPGVPASAARYIGTCTTSRSAITASHSTVARHATARLPVSVRHA